MRLILTHEKNPMIVSNPWVMVDEYGNILGHHPSRKQAVEMVEAIFPGRVGVSLSKGTAVLDVA